jgi:hypothetical protein
MMLLLLHLRLALHQQLLQLLLLLRGQLLQLAAHLLLQLLLLLLLLCLHRRLLQLQLLCCHSVLQLRGGASWPHASLLLRRVHVLRPRRSPLPACGDCPCYHTCLHSRLLLLVLHLLHLL